MLADAQLFSKTDNLAERLDMGLGEPEPIKYDIKLTGFGAAAKLDGQGCAVQPSPYRCVSALLDARMSVHESAMSASFAAGVLHVACLLYIRKVNCCTQPYVHAVCCPAMQHLPVALQCQLATLN